MFPRALISRLICTFFALVCCSLTQAAPLLNGIAVHQELGNEQFIGALYAETLSNNADTLINSKLPMRMELKVVAPGGIPTRRFSRMWIEGMAINNSNNLLTAQADNMVTFDGLFKGTLAERDHVVFNFRPNAGVDISVNNIVLGTIADDEFFSMLLRTWIGRVPLSSGYRDSLLKMGDVPAALRSRYDGLQFDPARTAVINGWVRAEEPAQVAAVPAPTPRAEPPRPEPAAPQPARPTIEPPVIAAPRIEVTTPDPEPEVIASADEPEPTPAATPAEPEPAPAPATLAVADTDDDDEDAGPALTAQSLLARQFYISDALKKIRSNVTYPRLSMERNQQGSMRIAVTLDRNGNIVDMAWLEESRHDRLNREAWEAVRRSAPFPPMPAALPGQRLEFTAPISFEMQR